MNEELAQVHPCYSITFTRQSKHSPERLWRAITDSAEVSRWMGESGYGKAEVKSFRTLPDLRLLIARAV